MADIARRLGSPDRFALPDTRFKFDSPQHNAPGNFAMKAARVLAMTCLCLGMAGCGKYPDPHFLYVIPLGVSDPDKAALDLRAMVHARADIGGRALARGRHLIAPGSHTITFDLDDGAVKLNKKCGKGSFEQASPTPPLLLLPIWFAIVAAEAEQNQRCRAAGKENSHRCFRVTFTARRGATYIPHGVRKKPVLIDSETDKIVSVTEQVPCAGAR